ncbi:MAG TPA: serine/threonine-protein kinase, partial [Thermoanaerobaculia bacterium]|nr:serine/threonine-protein kinase [Thermoanaerobaculia bacterium]
MSRLSQIGKYRLLDRIGEGAMGEVFRAHDPVLDRHVALKIITAGDEDRRQRFRREAQSAARLGHPNIVVVHDFGEDSGHFFMAMELLEGHDLKLAISSNLLPDLPAKLQVMEQVCDAMGYAHSMGIIHRDLKPANIFLLPWGRVKILDFGLARVGQSDMTGTGTILGTPNYMSPEQIRGVRIDPRADIFALGSVFYEMLSGRKAFNADSLHTVLYRVLQHEPEPLRMIAPSVPLALSDLIRKAMAKEPAMRFQSTREMGDAIRALRSRDKAAPNVGLNEMMHEYKSDTIVVGRHDGDGGHGAVSRPGGGRVPARDLRPAADVSLPSGQPMAASMTSMSAETGPARVVFAAEIGGDIAVDVTRSQTLLAASLAFGIPHTNECGG